MGPTLWIIMCNRAQNLNLYIFYDLYLWEQFIEISYFSGRAGTRLEDYRTQSSLAGHFFFGPGRGGTWYKALGLWAGPGVGRLFFASPTLKSNGYTHDARKPNTGEDNRTCSVNLITARIPGINRKRIKCTLVQRWKMTLLIYYPIYIKYQKFNFGHSLSPVITKEFHNSQIICVLIYFEIT